MTRPARPGKTPDRSEPRTVGTYRVAGGKNVFGVEPGGTVNVDMPTAAFDSLVEAGHLEPVPAPSAPAKTAPASEPTPVVIKASDSATASDTTGDAGSN